MLSKNEKQNLKEELVGLLRTEREISRIVIFGSFLDSAEPHDLDVAVFQDSDEKYLPLAMKYRRIIRNMALNIPVDIFPLRADAKGEFFMDEISRGEVVYERRD